MGLTECHCAPPANLGFRCWVQQKVLASANARRAGNRGMKRHGAVKRAFRGRLKIKAMVVGPDKPISVLLVTVEAARDLEPEMCDAFVGLHLEDSASAGTHIPPFTQHPRELLAASALSPRLCTALPKGGSVPPNPTLQNLRSCVCAAKNARHACRKNARENHANQARDKAPDLQREIPVGNPQR